MVYRKTIHDKSRNGGRLFISHSSKDEDLATGVVQHLLSLGVSCWIAPRDIPPGEDWAESVLQAIDDAGCLILVATVSSFSSGQVRREIERASGKGIPILPVVFDDAAIPDWLRYHVREESYSFFNRSDTADAALQIMLKLHAASVSCSGSLQSGKLLGKIDFKELKQEATGRDLPLLFSGERRPVYVLWLRLGDEIPMGLHTLILASVERLFQKTGAVRVPMALSGALYVFDALAVGNVLETVIGCGIALEGFLDGVSFNSTANEMEIDAGIGLSVGVAVSSSVSDLIDEITDAVNESRSLAEVSESKLLVSADIQRRFSYACNFVEFSSNVFCVQENDELFGDDSSHHSIPMVGGENELSLLITAGEDLNTAAFEPGLGHGSLKVIGISGGHGLGKTRLVRKFAEELKPESDITVFIGQASDSSWKHDKLWDSLLRNTQSVIKKRSGFLGINSGGPAGISAKLSLLLNQDENGCSTEPAVGELGGWRDSLLKLLKTVAFNNSLVVVLEDVDRADSSSIETLRVLTSAHYINAKILFVITYTDLTGDMVNRISLSTADDVNFHEMELNPLNVDDSEKLITLLLQRAGGRSVDPVVMQLLLRLGSGSPLFLKQLVDHVVEQNLLNSHNRELCKIDEYEFLAPAMKAAAFTAFSHINWCQRDLLRIASILDEDFCVSDIRAFGEGQFSRDDLLDRMGDLVAEGFLTVNGDSFTAKYRFTHEYMKLVAHSTVSQEDLKLLNIGRRV